MVLLPVVQGQETERRFPLAQRMGSTSLFTKASKDAKEEMRYEVKPGENQLKVDIRTK